MPHIERTVTICPKNLRSYAHARNSGSDRLRTVAVSLFSVFLVFFVSGCASVTRGTTDALVINTVPPGADVSITKTSGNLSKKELKENFPELTDRERSIKEKDFSGPITAKTPAAILLSRKGEYKVEINKEGYYPVEIRVTHEVSGAGGLGMAGNVLVGGVVGIVVDSASGSTHDLVPNPIDIELEKIKE